MITRLTLSNFRSFDSADVELGAFNVLVGANAAGKSNLVAAIRFLRDIERHGLANAVSMQGGVEYLRNALIGASRPMTIAVTISRDTYFTPMLRVKGANSYVRLEADELTISFSLGFAKRAPTYHILSEELTARVTGTVLVLDRDANRFRNDDKDFRGVFSVVRVGTTSRHILTFDEATEGGPRELEFEPDYVYMNKIHRTELMWHEFTRYLVRSPLLSDVAIYDFDPKLPKRSVQITGRQELEEDGSNLALVLQSILRNRASKRELTNLVRNLLPFVNTFSVQSIADRSVYFSLHDRYTSSGSGFPAAFMSDGTINVLALVCAGFFTSSSSMVIEEPERNLHPALISKVVELLREASARKQVLLTTHSPEVLKYAGLEAILIAKRGLDGFTRVSEARKSESTRIFLEEDIGLDELFVQNLLGT